jgi:hypothetical protein
LSLLMTDRGRLKANPPPCTIDQRPMFHAQIVSAGKQKAQEAQGCQKDPFTNPSRR